MRWIKWKDGPWQDGHCRYAKGAIREIHNEYAHKYVAAGRADYYTPPRGSALNPGGEKIPSARRPLKRYRIDGNKLPPVAAPNFGD